MSFEDMGKEVGQELDWDGEIQKDPTEYILLPEGDYEFKVTKFQRERYNGGDKLPACNKAALTLTIETAEGEANINHNLFLHSRTEGMVSAFFIGIGLKKHGEPFKMDWNQVIGCTGRAKVGVKTYNDKQYNEIKRFYDPSEQAPKKDWKKGGTF